MSIACQNSTPGTGVVKIVALASPVSEREVIEFPASAIEVDTPLTKRRDFAETNPVEDGQHDIGYLLKIRRMAAAKFFEDVSFCH